MIEVRIKRCDFLETPAIAIHAEVISRLKKAGIPVSGTLVFHGIDRGILIKHSEIGEEVYRWQDGW